MLNIIAIDHIVLRTANLKKMLAFYTKVLGCHIERETSPELGLTQLRAGNALIDVVDVQSTLGKMGGGEPSKSENNLDHFCLRISPISDDSLFAHLKKWDVETSDFAERYGAEGFGRSLYIKDPDGNTVELKYSKQK